ncbi:hypothetical protein [uncultured Parabacteroides sp.]|uniref:hypothetical protein n=1 Tax=uncultured Parabacteroides sp. TaxID=512312 RepID=UPI002804C153|nr:hypothetical protein [uncultured Parabacteroides sp.]
MKTRLQIKWQLPVLLLTIVLIGSGACSEDEVNWKKEIEGSVFKDFKTILYIGKIPKTVDKDNSVYLYYPDKTNPIIDEFGNEEVGYFRYSIPFVALYTDGHKYKLVDEYGVMDAFLNDKQISKDGLQIELSGTIIKEEGLSFDTQYYFFKLMNIKKQEE